MDFYKYKIEFLEQTEHEDSKIAQTLNCYNTESQTDQLQL